MLACHPMLSFFQSCYLIRLLPILDFPSPCQIYPSSSNHAVLALLSLCTAAADVATHQSTSRITARRTADNHFIREAKPVLYFIPDWPRRPTKKIRRRDGAGWTHWPDRRRSTLVVIGWRRLRPLQLGCQSLKLPLLLLQLMMMMMAMTMTTSDNEDRRSQSRRTDLRR